MSVRIPPGLDVPPWPVLTQAERDRAHGRLDPIAVRKGFEEELQVTPISEHGFQAHLLMRRILDQKGGVEFVCELFQPANSRKA
jgi:hypothetical protein